jgi:hypothetical protein
LIAPFLKPAVTIWSRSLAARPGTIVPLRTATVTLPGLTAKPGDRDKPRADPDVPGLGATGRSRRALGPIAQPLYVTRLREIEGQEQGQAHDRGQPRGSADLLD